MTPSIVLKEELNDNEVILMLALVLCVFQSFQIHLHCIGTRGSCGDVPTLTEIKNTRPLVVGEGLQESCKGMAVIVLESP